MVLEHAFDGQREVVVAGALAVPWAGDGILARMVGTAFFVHARRDDADRLAFKHGERHGAKIKHDMVRIVVTPRRFAHFSHAHIAADRRADRLGRRFRAVQIGVGMRCRPRGHGGTKIRTRRRYVLRQAALGDRDGFCIACRARA